jgi:transposase
VSGRKRHLVVDTQGFVLKVVVSAAEVQDRDGARLLAHAVRLYGPHLPRLSLVWADAAYAGQLAEDLRELMGWTVEVVDSTVEVVKRSETQPCSAFAAQRLCRAAPLPCNRIAGSWNAPSVGSGAVAACPRTTSIKSSRARRSFMPP